ncbi:9108_t:CDS:1 [Acaulospora morrowiae]|uniref:9108_t:CDS:1 n=1 Tax=Acaulospora morrowiae TaxID=94023 RepID=A0A9N9AN41_9GLOM|nr:9108_t:CDS:1 [Acaulospora morrowiae]
MFPNSSGDSSSVQESGDILFVKSADFREVVQSAIRAVKQYCEKLPKGDGDETWDKFMKIFICARFENILLNNYMIQVRRQLFEDLGFFVPREFTAFIDVPDAQQSFEQILRKAEEAHWNS